MCSPARKLPTEFENSNLKLETFPNRESDILAVSLDDPSSCRT